MADRLVRGGREGDDLTLPNLTTIPQQATTGNDQAVSNIEKLEDRALGQGQYRGHILGVMIVPGFLYQQQMSIMNFVYNICHHFFERLNARITETRDSISGRVRGLSSQFFTWKDSIGKRISDVEERVRDNWKAITDQRSEMTKLKQQMSEYEQRLTQLEKKE